ncbi:unnamed protein product [Vitrella brassicaformis CCMP3155]|uniref:N-acetyltransferase domain-containing protein n=1 Tax=Vitrella brassicaformis (strain CCMP3155) TaxID=1169540 RepID=A0A0G4GQQ8_VITBC|nr:unnamed protein product [Vitrella brassicaformis CCMP3155]|eukprot:CEM32638.1 unnamed protein product [Vitrella brassicaformis CCMP3155]
MATPEPQTANAPQIPEISKEPAEHHGSFLSTPSTAPSSTKHRGSTPINKLAQPAEAYKAIASAKTIENIGTMETKGGRVNMELMDFDHIVVEEVDQMGTLWRTILYEEFGIPKDDDLDKDFRTPDVYFHKSARGALICVRDVATDSIVGTSGIKHGGNPSDPNEAELTRVYLYEAYRGSGVGKRMVILCLDHAWALGYRIVTLTTSSCHVPAFNLYRKLGFEQMPPDRRRRGSQFMALDLQQFEAHHPNEDNVEETGTNEEWVDTEAGKTSFLDLAEVMAKLRLQEQEERGKEEAAEDNEENEEEDLVGGEASG